MTADRPASRLLSRIAELEEMRARQGREIVRLDAEVGDLKSEVRLLKGIVAELREEGAKMEERYTALLSLCRSVESRLPFDADAFVRSLRRRSGDFELGKQIGAGLFENSHLGVERSSGKEFAIAISRSPFSKESERLPFLRRVAIPLVLNLPRVLSPLAFCTDADSLWDIAEFFPNGDIGAASKGWQDGRAPEGFGPTQLTKCVFGIAFTMAGIHARGVIHRELSPESILLDSRFEPVIGSLAWARILSESSLMVPCTASRFT
jgi:serine/threonine protein kinase